MAPKPTTTTTTTTTGAADDFDDDHQLDDEHDRAAEPRLALHAVGFGAAVTGGNAVPPTNVTDCVDDPVAPPAGSLPAILATPGPHHVKWASSCTTHLTAALPIPPDTTLDGSRQAVTLTDLNDDHDGLVVDHVTNVITHNLTITDFGVAGPTPVQRQAGRDG